MNIIDNAAKYGKDGGRVQITMESDSYSVQIYVRDWGVGIPEDELPFVKEKFYKGSSKQRGSGIGLAVTDEIVRMHSGMLNITSKQGEGTCVMISLPLAEVAPISPTKVVEPERTTEAGESEKKTEETSSEQ